MDSTTHTLRRGIISQCALPTGLLIVAAVFAALAMLNPTAAGNNASLAMIFAGLAMSIWSLRHYSCIIVAPQGVTVRRVGYTVFARWEDVLDVEYRTPAAIELKTPVQKSGLSQLLQHAVAWRDRFRYPGCQNTLANGTLIALTPFQQHIKTGELRRAIRRHWPLNEATKRPLSEPRVHARLHHTAQAA